MGAARLSTVPEHDGERSMPKRKRGQASSCASVEGSMGSVVSRLRDDSPVQLSYLSIELIQSCCGPDSARLGASLLGCVLADCNRRKGGVGILEDAERFSVTWGLPVLGRTELAVMAAQRLITADSTQQAKQMGLKGIASAVLGVQMQKSKRVTMSDWSSQCLREDQV